MDTIVFFEVVPLLLLPLTKVIFYISSQNSPLHPKQLLPRVFGLNENVILSFAFIAFLTWTASVAWYTIMVFAVMGTIYIST